MTFGLDLDFGELDRFIVAVTIALPAAFFAPSRFNPFRRNSWSVALVALTISGAIAGVWFAYFGMTPGSVPPGSYLTGVFLTVVWAVGRYRDSLPKRERPEYPKGASPPWRRRAEGPIGPASRAFDAYKQRPAVFAPPEHDRW